MFHTIIIAGNLGRDPEMRYTPNGQAVTNFSIASNRFYRKSDGEQVKETIWFRVTSWGKQAETCNNYLQKGSKVLIEGRLKPDENGGPRIWTTQDGTTRASFEVIANTVRFLDRKGETESTTEGSLDTPEEGGEDIPF